MEFGLRQALWLVRRWWWLLLLAPLVASFAARELEARFRGDEIPRYSAAATLLINPAQATGRTNYSASTYGELMLTESVLEPVVTGLDLPFGVDTLRERVHADPVVDQRDRATELLRVRVEDPDPQRAADIANAVTESFVSYLADQAVRLTGPTRAELDNQIEETRQQISDTQSQLQTLEQSPDSTDPTNQAQIDALRTNLNRLRDTHSDLLLTAQTMDLNAAAAQSQVWIADDADVPSEPVPEGGINPMIPAALAGSILAVAAVLLIAYFDNTIKTTAEVEALIGAPLLGAVPILSGRRTGTAQLFAVTQPQTEAADAIRVIRTNIEFAASERRTARLVISSPGPEEGKSTIAANLAVAMVQARRSVMLIDADLRRPSLHAIFGVRNDRGLSTLLARPDQPWWSAAVATMIPHLSLIPSGPLPPNPADLLSRDRLSRLLEEIGETVDFILIDTPPMLPMSDTLEIAARADGVILVSRANRTRRGALEASAARLRQGNVRVVGAVLNEQPRSESSYGYGYYAASQADLNANDWDRLSETSSVGQWGTQAAGMELADHRARTDRVADPKSRDGAVRHVPALK
ncbi:MAG: polysaccharide biosynthesis tyrosine autokinase [Thermomicrobiales bacterium]